MRFFIVTTFVSFASFIQGQSIDSLIAQLPSCSLPCVDEVYKAGGCTAGDYDCGCGLNLNSNYLQTLTVQCFSKACTPSEIIAFDMLAGQICAQASTGGVSSNLDDILGPYTSSLGLTSIPAASTASTFVTSGSSRLGFQTGNPTSSTNGGGSTSNPSSSGGSKSSLSTGAAVGVGVSVTLAGLAILAAAIFFCLRYRKRGMELRQLELSNPQAVAGAEGKVPEVKVDVMQPEIDGRETIAAPKYEADPYRRQQGYEGGGGGMPSELGNQEWGVNGLVELPGVHCARNGP
ncbi:hypothetical protein BKA65DRAFT_225121 [Rhexocercosporidium sp. MPI-PUGE-AT-0058]|nr:hypothetical protein BKA65DRAFT_225121 [Rhexocercosporidium sp. MPI-PUGE-AT-0058]